MEVWEGRQDPAPSEQACVASLSLMAATPENNILVEEFKINTLVSFVWMCHVTNLGLIWKVTQNNLILEDLLLNFPIF